MSDVLPLAGFVIGITCFPAAAVWEAMRVRGS